MKFGHKFCIVLMLIALSKAQGEEARHDMRELCRSEVSGTLLTAYNDVDYMRGLISQSDQKIKDTKARLQTLDQEYARMRNRAPGAIPSFDLDEKVVSLRFEVDILQEQIREAEKHIAENRQDMQKREAFRKAFEELIQPVFKVIRAKDSPPGAYTLRAEYRHACGPYEMLCTLPQDHAQALRRIAEKLSLPQWCERYAQLPSP